VPCFLPKKSPWLSAIEPKWVHGKRKVVEPDLVLAAYERAYRSASAAQTARPFARRSASKTACLPAVGVCCALTETVTERLPSGLAAANWV
jgi:hypothetical protein